MYETVRYNFRLRPGAQAKAALTTEWNRCRFLWNEAVHQQKAGKRPTFCRLSKLLTAARSKFTWLRDGSQVAQQQTLRDYSRALQDSFEVKGRARPTFKKRKTSLPSLEYTQRGFSIREGRLRLPNRVSVPVVWSRELPSAPTSVRVYQDSLGHWYASFVVRRESDALDEVAGRIGIDWGVTTTAIATDPAYDLPYAGHRKRCAAELAKAQRKMSRRKKPRGRTPTKGYQNAKLQVARLRKKAARQNTHTGRTWAKAVVDNHQVIAVEDLRGKFLTKSRMARKAADAAIGSAKRTLIEYGTRAGRAVVLVPPAYTTMTCSKCGERQARLGLAERIFRCTHCGHTADRDRNAAWTILAKAESSLDGVDDVRHRLSHPFEVAVAGAV